MSEKKKVAKPTPISAEAFVTAWQKATTRDEAIKALGTGASSRAQRMRKAGVKLKVFEGGRKPLDVKALNALISK